MTERQEVLICYGVVVFFLSMIYGAIFAVVVMWEFGLAESHAGFHPVDMAFWFVAFPAGYVLRYLESWGYNFDNWMPAYAFDAVFWAITTVLVFRWFSNRKKRKRDKSLKEEHAKQEP